MSRDDLFIDDSMSQNNGNRKFRDIILDWNKTSSSRVFIFVVIYIIAFLLGYFTFRLISPASENHEILLGGKADFNYSEITINNNQTNLDETPSRPRLESVTKFTTESSINKVSTSENIHDIITEGNTKQITSTRPTLPKIFTTVQPITENSAEFATIELQEEMISCLRNLTNRFEETNSTVPDKCFSDPIALKSLIIFEQSNNSLFDCLITKDENCDKLFHKFKGEDVNNFHLKDIRYNFLMRGNGKLYVGRPLSCSFDDTKDSKLRYNNSQIIIGMPSCHKLDSLTNQNKMQFLRFVRKPIDCLDKHGILSSEYQMRFHKNCKHYIDVTVVKYLRYRVKFINDKDEYED